MPEKWLSGLKHDKNCIFILKFTHGRRIKGIVRSDIHGWALSEEAIQSPNHELRWLTPEGKRYDMMEFLRGLGCSENGETTVMIGNGGNKKTWTPFPARLIAVALPPEKAQSSRARVLSDNRRKGRVDQAETREAAGHVLLLTSLPEHEYSAEQVADCYRLRWQIELAFKHLKSLLQMDALRAKDTELAKAWIFANLLVAFLIDDMI